MEKGKRRSVAILIDGQKIGIVYVAWNASERIIARAAMGIPEAARLLRLKGIYQAKYARGQYDVSTGKRPGGPLSIEEAIAIPGVRFVRPPFRGLGLPSPQAFRSGF
jgi:hypothetical protein